MAIAWMSRADYAWPGPLVLPRGEPSRSLMSLQALVASLALVPVSMSPTVIGGAGPVYFVVATILGPQFLYYSATLAFQTSNPSTRQFPNTLTTYLPPPFS